MSALPEISCSPTSSLPPLGDPFSLPVPLKSESKTDGSFTPALPADGSASIVSSSPAPGGTSAPTPPSSGAGDPGSDTSTTGSSDGVSGVVGVSPPEGVVSSNAEVSSGCAALEFPKFKAISYSSL